jgi:peptidoglycan/LPS O-acetylase OafA/YrhL
MKPFLLLAGLLLVAGPAAAQAAGVGAAERPVAAPTGSLAAPDTLAAIHRLFAARRQRRNLIAAGAAGAALAGTAVASTTYDRFFSTADYGKLYGLGAGLIIAVDFIATMDYSRKEERLAVESFQNHQLSPRLKRRLKARYFR